MYFITSHNFVCMVAAAACVPLIICIFSATRLRFKSVATLTYLVIIWCLLQAQLWQLCASTLYAWQLPLLMPSSPSLSSCSSALVHPLEPSSFGRTTHNITLQHLWSCFVFFFPRSKVRMHVSMVQFEGVCERPMVPNTFIYLSYLPHVVEYRGLLAHLSLDTTHYHHILLSPFHRLLLSWACIVIIMLQSSPQEIKCSMNKKSTSM